MAREAKQVMMARWWWLAAGKRDVKGVVVRRQNDDEQGEQHEGEGVQQSQAYILWLSHYH
jgi:hypothetical protein